MKGLSFFIGTMAVLIVILHLLMYYRLAGLAHKGVDRRDHNGANSCKVDLRLVWHCIWDAHHRLSTNEWILLSETVLVSVAVARFLVTETRAILARVAVIIHHWAFLFLLFIDSSESCIIIDQALRICILAYILII